VFNDKAISLDKFVERPLEDFLFFNALTLSVGLYVACKRRWNDLLCVKWYVKPYSLTHSYKTLPAKLTVKWCKEKN